MRSKRWQVAAVVGLASALAALGGWGLRQARLADDRLLLAAAREQHLARKLTDAEQELARATDATVLTESRRLAAAVRGDLPRRHTRDVLLAVEAARRPLDRGLAVPPEVLGTLASLTRTLRPSRTLAVEATSAALALDGRRLLTVESHDALKLWPLDGDDPPVELLSEGTIDGLQWSPDGKRVAVETSREGVHLVRVDVPDEPPRRLGDAGRLPRRAFSPDGRRLLLAEHLKVSVWNAELGSLLAELTTDDWMTEDAAFTPDGHSVVVVAADGTVRVHPADGLGEPVVHRLGGPLGDAVLSPDTTLVAGHFLENHTTGKAFVRRTDGAGAPRILHKGGFAPHLRFHPRGDAVLSLYPYAGEALLESVDGRSKAHDLACKTGRAQDAAFSGDGRRVVVTCDDGALWLWDLSDARFLPEPSPVHGQEDHARVIGVSHDGRRIVTGAWDGPVRIWQPDARGEPWVLPRASRSWIPAVFSPDGDLVAVPGDADDLHLWRPGGDAPLARFSAPDHRINAIAFSPDGRRIVTAGDEGTARIWWADDPDTLDDSIALADHDGGVADASFAPNGARVVTGSADHKIRIWPVGGTDPPVVLSGHTGPVTRVAFLPGGRAVASAAEDDTIRIWPLAGTTPPVVLRGRAPGHIEHLRGRLALSPDGRLVAVVGDERATIRLHRTDGTGPPIQFSSQPAPIDFAAFAPDGATIAVASSATIHLWPVDGQGAPRLLRPLARAILELAHGPDGTLVATTDDAVWIWRRDDGAPVVLDVAAASAAMSPRGDAVLIQAGGTAQVWSLDARRLLRFACAHVGRNLRRDEWDHALPGAPHRATCPEWPESPL